MKEIEKKGESVAVNRKYATLLAEIKLSRADRVGVGVDNVER